MGSERPLQGRRIAVTRPRGQAEPLARELERWGAEAILCPTIRIADREGGELLRALARLDAFDWVVFTSANGVRAFWDALGEVGSAGRLPGHMRVAAIGPATARALERRGVDAEIVPEEYVAEAVAEALTRRGDLSGARILLPRAARELGLSVHVEASEYTVDGLVAAIVDYYVKTEGEG